MVSAQRGPLLQRLTYDRHCGRARETWHATAGDMCADADARASLAHLSDVVFEALRDDVAEIRELVSQHGEAVDDGLAVEGE